MKVATLKKKPALAVMYIFCDDYRIHCPHELQQKKYLIVYIRISFHKLSNYHEKVYKNK